MSTDLSTGSIPSEYLELFQALAQNDSTISGDIYSKVLQSSQVDESIIQSVNSIAGTTHGSINRVQFYKTLALIGWHQQGKILNEKLFENFNGTEYPVPVLKSLESITTNSPISKHPAMLGLTYSQIALFDTINVELVPEKKGLFLKHSEYCVTSKRFNSKVARRYTDFVALYELLLSRYPYRIIPRLPPKKIYVSDDHFLEARRRSLHRWLTLIARHPYIYLDPTVSFFLVELGPDVQGRIRNIFGNAPDEFMTSDFAETAKDLVPSDGCDFASNREQVKSLVQILTKIKQVIDSEVDRIQVSARDNDEMAKQLRLLGNNATDQLSSENWTRMRYGFSKISGKLTEIAVKEHNISNVELITVGERLSLVLDMLVGHRDLCDRLEKGLAQDHQLALSKMLTLKKRKIQGVIKGIDTASVEQLESKMLSQENVITNMEMRSNFSLYCAYMETQLVHVYLETLGGIFARWVSMKVQNQSEVSCVWTEMIPIVEKCFATVHRNGNGKLINGNKN